MRPITAKPCEADEAGPGRSKVADGSTRDASAHGSNERQHEAERRTERTVAAGRETQHRSEQAHTHNSRTDLIAVVLGNGGAEAAEALGVPRRAVAQIDGEIQDGWGDAACRSKRTQNERTCSHTR